MKYYVLFVCGLLLINLSKGVAQFSKVEMDMGRITLDEVTPLINEVYKTNKYLKSAEAIPKLDSSLNRTVNIKRLKALNKKLTGPEIYRQLSRSTLLLISTSQRATAYVIEESGIIITNYHVLQMFGDTTKKRKEPLIAMTVDRHFYPVTEVLASSKVNDISILRINVKNDRLSPITFAETAEVGSDIFVLGNPAHMLNYFTKGIVAQNFIRDQKNPQVGEDFRMAVTADYSLGQSGGPIVNEFGNLVGMVSSAFSLFGDPDKRLNPQMVVKSAIPVIAIRQLLK